MKSLFLFIALLCSSSLSLSAERLSLEAAVQRAINNDVWLQGSEMRQSALGAESIAAGELPDPVVNLGLRNLPMDSFSLSREPMTQVSLGITQHFPRGDTRRLQQERLMQLSQVEPHLRADRSLKVALQVTEIWLQAYLAEKIARLIEADRGLFEHLVDVAESSYSTAVGKTRQQDLIRAQLELTRLDEKLISLRERFDAHRARLSQWVGYAELSAVMSLMPSLAIDELPDVASATVMQVLESGDSGSIVDAQLLQHPRVVAIDQKISAAATDVDLAQQGYKPQWGLSTAYAYRSDERVDRDDFLSVGVSFDLPIFTGRRQDQKVASASRQVESMRLERVLVLRSLRADFETVLAEHQRLRERRDLYTNRLLREMDEQADASLQAYTNDDGDFAEAVRARIADLNARIDVLNIEVSLLSLQARANYLLAAELPAADTAGGINDE